MTDKTSEEEDLCPCCFLPAEECAFLRWLKEEPKAGDAEQIESD